MRWVVALTSLILAFIQPAVIASADVAPMVVNIYPTSGPVAGGTSVNITGTGFASGATVTIGGNAATNVTATSTLIRATTPAGTAGVKTVVVTNPDAQSGNLTGGFTYLAQAPVLLGSARSFAILAYSGITNTGLTTVSGDVGSFPTATEIGFGPGADSVTFTTGTNHAGDNVTQQAKLDLTTAYNDAAGRTPVTTVTGDTLGGLTPAPGIYHGGALSLTGNITLNGDANAVWIFKAASTLDTAAGSKVILSGGVNAANVYWVVGSSATLGANSTFKGNILAYASITLYGGVALEGRALAQTAHVTLNANAVATPPPIAVLTAPAPISLGTFIVGDNKGHSNPIGSVVADTAGWTLTVADAKANHNGYMTIGGSDNGSDIALAAAITVSTSDTGYSTIAAYQIALQGSGGGYGVVGTFNIPLFVKQAVAITDAKGSYKISLTYTATPGF